MEMDQGAARLPDVFADGFAVLARLQAGDESLLTLIYTTFAPEFSRWAARCYGADAATAQDAFQDAVVVTWDHARSGHLAELRAGLKTYLFGIGRHRLLKAAAAAHRLEPLPEFGFDADFDAAGPQPTPAQEQELALAADSARLAQLLGPVESVCRRLLEGFYFERLSLAALADQLGYRTEAVARKKKCLCLRALRETVSRQRLTLDSFFLDWLDQPSSLNRDTAA